MADDFSTLARASFAGIEFPLLSCRMRGSSRNHVHIYAHVPGGDVEKLGRNLYEIEMHIPFLTSATAYSTQASPLWPTRLALLRGLFEAETTDWLVIPTVGRIKAYATEWEQEMQGNVHNGEHASFKFLEDQSAAFLLAGLITTVTKSVSSTAQQLSTITTAMALADQLGPQRDRSLFETIQRTANDLLAFRDQAELAGSLITEKVAMLTSLCNEADRTVQAMKDPVNWQLVEAVKELWDAARQFGEAIVGPQNAFATYTLPLRMTIGQVSMAIFGTTDKAMDLLQLNPIDNAFDIPAGIVVRYLRDEVSAAAA
jgi:DNA circularisation protein